MTDFRLPPLSAGERLYRALIALYPPRFRRAFALDLIETFRDQRREARQIGMPAGAFWMATLQDLLTQAFAEWMFMIWRIGRPIHDSDREESPMAAVPVALRFAELRFAARRLLRVPSFTIATVLVLALGIGATTAVFSVVNGVLLRPLPYPQSDRLVSLTHTLEVGGVHDAPQSDATVLLYQEHASAFDGIAATRNTDVNLAALSASDRARRVEAAATTANLFDVLRVHPLYGRAFQSGEDRPGAAPVAILSYALWQDRYRGDRGVIGQRIVIDGVSRQIVGVMPRGFSFPQPATALWIPVVFDPAHASAGSFNYDGVGRLRDGVTIQAAQADLARWLPHLLDEFPSGIPPEMWKQAHVQAHVESLRDAKVGDVSRLLWILLASVSMVLLIACANVANLFLVRGESRQLELAVRGALGSGLAGILAQSLSESALLAGVGGFFGVIIALISVKLATSVGGALGLPRLDEVNVDGTVLLFAFGVSVLCAILVSIIPVLRARRVPVAMVLRAGGRGSTGGGPRQRARSVLVIAQTALALVLVAASGLLARSFMRLEQVKPGFNADGVSMARVVLPKATYTTTAAKMQFYDALLAKVRALPGVSDATLGDWVPLSSDHNDNVIFIEDHPLPPNGVPDSHFTTTVDAHYFHTMQTPLIRGRTFGTSDPKRGTAEAVVSRAFARQYWKDESPIGKRIRPSLDGQWYTIVGEVEDAHYDALDQPANTIVYFPMVTPDSDSTYVPNYLTVLVRSAAPSGTVTAAVRDIVHSLDPALPTYDEQPLGKLVHDAAARAREMLLLLAIASVLALVLGAVGIYGVMAYGVSLRQREIGVRIALGAQPSQVRRMISRNGVGLAAIGVGIGVAVAIGVMRFLQSLLYDVSPTDPVILISTCAVLLLVALAASWIPARRAAAVDPSEALRGG
ncbi:MAG TPA: ABC transporter permease [Gemmatimonadaceae bacterium]|nr:ABC transporter permease [Gemmatimonadaceae bacterium]